MINKIYSSKKDTEVKAVVISVEEKFGTVLIKYLTGDKTGKTANITTSTLKRWWKEIKENNDADDIMIQKEDPTIEVPDINSLSEIKEIKTEPKSKEEYVEHSNNDTFENLKLALENAGFNIRTRNIKNFMCVRHEGEKTSIADIIVRTKFVQLKIKNMPVTSFEVTTNLNNHFPFSIKVPYTDDLVSNIISLL